MRLNYTQFFSHLSPAFGDLLRRVSRGYQVLVSRFAFPFDGRSRSPVSSDLSAHRLVQDRLWHTFSFIDSEQLARGLDGESLCIFRVEEFKVIRSQRDGLCLN